MISVDYAVRLLNLPRYSELGNAAMKPGLRGVSILLDAMGNPERDFASVHVAGTNGKGSVASMIAAIGQVAGYRIGLYTSPHLLHLSERIRLNGSPVPADWMQDALDRYGSLFDHLQPSFFEAMTALGFLFFAESSVDFAIVETGLGGRLDATNILCPKLSVITQIDLDHTQTLGNTLASITREKAGIIKKKTPVIAVTGRDATQKIIQDVARRQHAPWIEAGQVVDNCLQTLAGVYELSSQDLRTRPHHAQNALLAARSAEQLFPETRHEPDLIQEGISRFRELTGLRARLEVLRQTPLTVLDVAHNPAAIAAALNYMPSTGTVHLLLALMKDKDLSGVMQVLNARLSLKVYACDLALRRALPAARLATTLRAHAISLAGTGSISAMWHLAQEQASNQDSILVCGSHMLAEAFLRSYL